MGRVRILPGGIVDTAITLVDREGFEALNLSTVANELGVRPSALYAHVDGLAQLRDQIAVVATQHLTTIVGSAAMGVAGTRALDAMGHAYRGFAHEYPGQYGSMLRTAAEDNIELLTATQQLHDVFARVFLGAGFDATDADLAAGSTRSAIHGFVALEHVGGSTPLHDERYDHLLQALHRGLEHS
jgi:AcrR family transcriptional regulator